MPALYHDDPLTTEHNTLLPKSEKHLSFDPELHSREIQNTRSKLKKRVTRRLHVIGLISLFLGLLFYATHTCWVSALDDLSRQQLTLA